MPVFDMGSYILISIVSSATQYEVLSRNRERSADLNDYRGQSYDYLLRQSLTEIFRGRCLTSGQIKILLRNHQNTIIKPILEQEPFVSMHFSKEELGKLSLLWIAVLGCYQHSAELLVRSGADVNEPFGRHDPQLIDEECTILYLLVQINRYLPGKDSLIHLITDHGADLQARDQLGRNVLYHAVAKGDVHLAEMFLERGVDVNVAANAIGREGMTPLLVVAFMGINDLVIKLTFSMPHRD